MTPAPAISVIMAAYKGASLVGETIASLQAQTFGDFELLVVDDCSPDDTLAVLRGFDDPRITVIASEANRGPVHARNRAFAAARGRYIAALDQDDICLPTRFAEQVAFLDAHPDVVLIGTAMTILCDGRLSPGGPPYATTPAMLDWLMYFGNPLMWSSVMFRAEAARKLDPFTRPDRLYAEDYDLYQRLRPFGRIARLDEALMIYRSHAAGASQTFDSRMIASAGQVLAAKYEPIFGDSAPHTARLVAAHVMAQMPAPDAATLAGLGVLYAQVHAYARALLTDAPSIALAEREYARSWWWVTRAAVRSGHVGLIAALAARPAGIPLGARTASDLLLSALIGQGRALRRRRASALPA